MLLMHQKCISQIAMTNIKDQELLLTSGNWDGHIGHLAKCFEGIHEGVVFGERNMMGDILIKFASSFNLVVTNFYSANIRVTFVLFNLVTIKVRMIISWFKKMILDVWGNVEIISAEEHPSQHNLLVCDLELTFEISVPKTVVPKIHLEFKWSC